MKNATRLHETGIVEFLERHGCEEVRYRKGAFLARRHSPEGVSYRVSVELYEDETALTPDRRYRARVARRFGLPLNAHSGATPTDALNGLDWRPLDAFRLPMPTASIAGLL